MHNSTGLFYCDAYIDPTKPLSFQLNQKRSKKNHHMSVEPVVNIARQAVSSLGGYAYQIYASALAWSTLQENETLLLEVAEDYAISTLTALSAVQVKRTSTNITLNSQAVVQAIDSFVELTLDNPNTEIKLRYLTTSEIAPEQKTEQRIKGQPCLAYWQTVRFHGDLDPLKSRLMESGISKRAKAYIRTLSDEEFRSRFIQKISWDCGAPDDVELRDQLRDALIYIGDNLGVLPSDSEKACDALISEVLNKAMSAGMRLLSRADLLRVFERATSQNISNAALQRLLSGNNQNSETGLLSLRGAIEPVNSSPFPAIYAQRDDLVAEISRRHSEHGVAWLFAGTGFGKTLLAISNAIQAKRDAGMVRLRGLSAEQAEILIEKARRALLFTTVGELIVDDLNHLQNPSVQVAVGKLIKSARANGKLVTVCAYERPTDRAFDTLSVNREAALGIGKFDDADIKTMIHFAPDNHDAWVRYVRISCSDGHPQLTHAMVLGLIRRNWPVSEISSMSALMGQDEDIVLTKEEARKRLVGELPEQSRRLLYRLTFILSGFHRDLAKAVCEADPVIANPGEALDDLVGPWVDRVSDTELQVSPLVGGSGAEQLSATEQQAVHYTIAQELTKTGTLDGNQFDQILLSGMAGKCDDALIRLALATLSIELERMRLLAASSVGLVLMRTDRPVYPSSPRVTAQLRAAQVMLILASKRTTNFRSALEAFESEANALEDAYGEDIVRMGLYGKLLLNPALASVYPEFPQMIAVVMKITEARGFTKDFDFPDTAGYKGGKLSAGMALFMQQMTQLASLDILEQILQVVSTLDQSDREAMVPRIDSVRYNPLQIVKMIWVREKEKDAYNSIDYLMPCLQFADRFRALGETEYAVSCYLLASIIHSEELKDKERALTVLDDAAVQFGELIDIRRQRASVYFIADEYRAQIEAIEPYLDELIEEGWIEKVYLYRELAISHGRLCEWVEAAEKFREAIGFTDKVEGGIVSIMAIGLQADMAVAIWNAGDRVRALREIAVALSSLKDVDPSRDLKSSALHRLVRFTGWWFYAEYKNLRLSHPSIEESATMVIGCNSNPNPHKGLKGEPVGTIELIYYLLAEVDLSLGGQAGIWENIVSRFSSDKAILVHECSLRIGIMTVAMEARDPILLSKFAAEKIDAVEIMESRFKDDFNVENPLRGRLPQASPEVFLDRRHSARMECNVFMLDCILNSEQDKIATLFELQKSAARPIISDDEILSYEHGTCSARDPVLSMCGALGELAKTFEAGARPVADNLLVISLRMFELLRNLTSFSQLREGFAQWAFEQWSASIREERFRFRTPDLAEADIYKALHEGPRTLVGVTKLIEAAAPYLTPSISPVVMAMLREYREFCQANGIQ